MPAPPPFDPHHHCLPMYPPDRGIRTSTRTATTMGLRLTGWTMVVVQVVKIEAAARQLVITRKGAAAGMHTNPPLKVERNSLTGLCLRSGNDGTVRLLTRGGTQSGDESSQVLDGRRCYVYIPDFHSFIPTCSGMNFVFPDGRRVV